jgi:hypothetical protein
MGASRARCVRTRRIQAPINCLYSCGAIRIRSRESFPTSSSWAGRCSRSRPDSSNGLGVGTASASAGRPHRSSRWLAPQPSWNAGFQRGSGPSRATRNKREITAPSPPGSAVGPPLARGGGSPGSEGGPIGGWLPPSDIGRFVNGCPSSELVPRHGAGCRQLRAIIYGGDSPDTSSAPRLGCGARPAATPA